MNCISIIDSDTDVTVARVKNRLHPSFDSMISAGYRNVALNIRIVTEETKFLGLETHVCEVQLLLLKMAEIKVRIYALRPKNLMLFYEKIKKTENLKHSSFLVKTCTMNSRYSNLQIWAQEFCTKKLITICGTE